MDVEGSQLIKNIVMEKVSTQKYLDTPLWKIIVILSSRIVWWHHSIEPFFLVHADKNKGGEYLVAGDAN